MGLFDLFAEKNAEFYRARSAQKKMSGDHAGALNDINTAIEMDSNNAEYYYKRGHIYMALSNKAARDYVFSNTSGKGDVSYSNLCQEDMKKASELGHIEAKKYLKKI